MSKTLEQLFQEAYEKQAKLEGDLDECDSLEFGEHDFDSVIEAVKEWLTQKRQELTIKSDTAFLLTIDPDVVERYIKNVLLEELNQL